MSISVVIPTWNEELWIPRLLKCLEQQRSFDQIIVADNNSSDATRRIAEESGCIITSGGHPGRARNLGARIAVGEILLFVDADSIFGRDVTNLVRTHMNDPETVAVHFQLRPISSSSIFRLCYFLASFYIRTLAYAGISQGVGSFMAIRRSAFLAVNGFDENIDVGEDADMFRRLSSIGKVVFERASAVYVSPRRLSLEHPVRFGLKCVLWSLLRVFASSWSIVRYRWERYPSGFAHEEAIMADHLLRRMGQHEN